MKSDCPLDYRIIGSLVRTHASVLDLGCGSGGLLQLLERQNKAHVQGIEIDDQAVYSCVAKGLCVLHGDIDTGLAEYGDKSFDYIILNQSLQQLRNVETVIEHSLRVAHKLIIGFPNFAYYKARAQIFFRGRTPVTPSLPYEWYNTPNLHFLSIADFIVYCARTGIVIEKKFFLAGEKTVRLFPNLLAQAGLFLVSR